MVYFQLPQFEKIFFRCDYKKNLLLLGGFHEKLNETFDRFHFPKKHEAYHNREGHNQPLILTLPHKETV